MYDKVQATEFSTIIIESITYIIILMSKKHEFSFPFLLVTFYVFVSKLDIQIRLE